METQSRRLIDKRQVAEKAGVSVRTVEGWEQRGIGPPSVKVGPRLRRYYEDEVEAWIAGK